MSFIAVSESTPGPLAVNMATFVGSSQGLLGARAGRDAGVVLPSFLLLLPQRRRAAESHEIPRRRGVSFPSGVRPCVVALILATAVTMGLTRLLGFTHLGDVPVPDIRSACAGGPCRRPFPVGAAARQSALPLGDAIGLSAVLGILLKHF